MTVRRDRLSVVVRLRAIEESRRQGELARATQAVALRERVVHGARRQYEERPMPEPVPFTPVQLRALQLQGSGALELFHEALAERDGAAADAERAQSMLTMASVSRRSAERLSERRATEAARAAQTAAERALDELVLLRRTAAANEQG